MDADSIYIMTAMPVNSDFQDDTVAQRYRMINCQAKSRSVPRSCMKGMIAFLNSFPWKEERSHLILRETSWYALVS
jgi:hypothetical protein